MSNSTAMTVEEVAQYLQLHPHTVYRKAKAGEIPGRLVGRSWRFHPAVIERWLLNSSGPRREATSAPNEEDAVPTPEEAKLLLQGLSLLDEKLENLDRALASLEQTLDRVGFERAEE